MPSWKDGTDLLKLLLDIITIRTRAKSSQQFIMDFTQIIFGATLRLSDEYFMNEKTPIELQIFLNKLRKHSSRLSQCI
ncbi:hypothetical protein V1478_000207 [Vespula squamosa]|uniref:Uncharacterized protein n=1 Tax=Vespula squamosa TaxID=30214 RepID=A0ABD2C4U6_VESSQ